MMSVSDSLQRGRVAGSDGPDRVACSSETFVSDQAQDAKYAVFVVTLKPVAEEVEPRVWLAQIDDPGFGRMQGEAGVRRPRLHLGQGAVRLIDAVTEDHEIICVTHHLPTAFGHLVVQGVEGDVRQQVTDHATLWSTRFRDRHAVVLHHSGFQEVADQLTHASIRDPVAYRIQQPLVRDAVEERLSRSTSTRINKRWALSWPSTAPAACWALRPGRKP